MTPEIYWISEVTPLRLGMMARPRSGDWLSDEISGWQCAGIKIIVSLLESHEVRELGLADEKSLCVESDIDFLTFPVPDRGTPKSVSKTASLVTELVSRLRRGDSVGIHCRAGIGRSGLLSACVLLQLGMPLAEVFPALTRARKVPVPDTPAQVEWVKHFAASTISAGLPKRGE